MKNSKLSLKTPIALALLVMSFLINTAFANQYVLFGTVGEGGG